MLKILYILVFAILFSSCEEEGVNNIGEKQSNTKIAIQPFKGFPEEEAQTIQENVADFYELETTILPQVDFPENAFVNIKSPRYRADTLIRFLRSTLSSDYNYVIGLTNKDISTTKYSNYPNRQIKKPEYKYKDWGLFGLGFCPGESCIVSTFRLKNKISHEQFIDRLTKISCHELGHNFGLPHCKNVECIMQDAAETIKTIDNVSLHLCNDCKMKIGMKN